MTPHKQIVLTTLVLLACLLWFEFTPTDLWLQQQFYDSATGHWLWDRDEPVLRFLLYDGIKKLFILFALGLLVALVFYRKSALVRNYRKGILVVLLALMIVPLVIGTLKATSNVACPRALTEFGGSVPHVSVFRHYPAGLKPASRQKCYPAGHASGGFALMSLFFLFHSRRNRIRGLWFGIASGWITGGYKMVIGDHFLSHTVVTMLLAWLLVNLIVLATQRVWTEPAAVGE